MSTTTIEEYISRAARPGLKASGLMVKISDLQAYKKEIDGLIEEQEFTWEKGWQTGKEDCYGDYDDEIDKFKGQVDEKTEQIKRLLRSMKRLKKENEKLKEDPQIIDYYHN